MHTSLHTITCRLQYVLTGTLTSTAGGPTGVEFSAELSDFVRNDIAVMYPCLIPMVQIILINSGARILNAFDYILQGIHKSR